jgi:hypothetical protein
LTKGRRAKETAGHQNKQNQENGDAPIEETKITNPLTLNILYTSHEEKTIRQAKEDSQAGKGRKACEGGKGAQGKEGEGA